MENEVVVVPEAHYDLSLARAPKQVLAEAQEAAKALQSVISTRKDAVKFNGKQYLAFEDWQTCGRFYGITAKVVSTESIEIDGTKGFIARAEAINTQTGLVISAAESMCMNDEPNWKSKPLFQLRSMAQTRACAKSLRNVLAWVVILAGYEPTPAEEMTGEEHAQRPPVQAPVARNGDTITEAQGKRLYAIWKGNKRTNEEVHAYLKSLGYSSTKDIKRTDYEDICLRVQSQEPLI